jgi:hypothetical protein
MKDDLRMEVFQKLSNRRMVTEVGLDKGRLRLDAVESPGFAAWPDQRVYTMTVGDQAPDELRPDPSRRPRDERRGAFLSDA